jgi:hypothetical protein
MDGKLFGVLGGFLEHDRTSNGHDRRKAQIAACSQAEVFNRLQSSVATSAGLCRDDGGGSFGTWDRGVWTVSYEQRVRQAQGTDCGVFSSGGVRSARNLLSLHHRFVGAVIG